MLLLYRTQQNLTVCSQYRPPAAWAGRMRGRYPDRTACPSHTPPLWTVKRELFYSSTGANKVPTSNNGEKLHWPNQPDGLFSRTKTKPNGLFLRLSTGKLTFDGRGNQQVEDLGAVAWFDQLIRTERVEVQRAATRLVLCFHNHHDVETVVGKIFSLGHRDMRWCHIWNSGDKNSITRQMKKKYPQNNIFIYKQWYIKMMLVSKSTCTVIAPFLVIVWYIPIKATLLSRS